jgi:hypothetical protein
MSTKSSSKDEQLRKLAEALKKAKSKTEIKRLNVQLDAILGIEESPAEEDREVLEAWERNKK